MASNNYFSITPGAAQYSALSAYAGAAAQAAIVQPTQTAFVAAAARAPTYEAYPTSQTATQQYTFATRTQAGAVAADYFTTPVVQAAQAYDSAKAYYTPVAAVTPGPAGAAIYTLPVDATAVYQATKYPNIYDAGPKKYYPIAGPIATPSAVPTTMYTVAAEPVYQTLAVGAKPLYVANTYPTMTPGRQMTTAIKLIQTAPLSAANAVSVASYAYQPVPAPSVIYSTPSVISAVVCTTAASVASSSSLFTSFASGVDTNTAHLAPASHYQVRSSVPTSVTPAAVASSSPQTFTSSVAWHGRRSTTWRSVMSKPAGTMTSTPQMPQQMYYCRICMIGCAGPQTYKEHLEGQRHKKKEASVKTSLSSPVVAPAPARAGVVQLHCQLCDVACTGADTYAAHIRGTKHQKVLKLHSTLGKSTSSTDRTATLSMDDKKDLECSLDDLDGLLGTENDVQPIGQEYIDEARNESGVAVGFYCKLCDCKFTDPNAKLMHMKGRRHRLQYKKKVDPNLQVDIRLPYGRRTKDDRDKKIQDDSRRRFVEDKWRMECEQLRYEEVMMGWQRFPGPGMPPPHMPMHPHHLPPHHHPFPPPPGFLPGPPVPPFGPPMPMRRPDTYNDRHVVAKHASIYPNEQELEAVQITVSAIEKALKLVSDSLTDSTSAAATATKTESLPATDDADKKSTVDGSDGRVLRSILRVGALAKGLLLHGDLHVQLIVLCAEKPTRTLLDTVADRLTKQLQAASNEYDVHLCVEEAGLVVTRLTEPSTSCSITLTSPIIRDPLLVVSPEQTTVVSKTDPPDVLDRQKCLDALAEQRRSKWFQARVSGVQACLVVLRIMRDLCRRDATWGVLTDWILELLVEKCLGGVGGLSPGDALRRVFECIASGILLTGSPGVLDPCEKDPTDVLDTLSNQLKEDITLVAQHGLRLIAFRQIHTLLGMESLASAVGPPVIPPARKRPFVECRDDSSKREKF